MNKEWNEREMNERGERGRRNKEYTWKGSGKEEIGKGEREKERPGKKKCEEGRIMLQHQKMAKERERLPAGLFIL